MKNKKIGDYVLGTHKDELERLGFQHKVWRDAALKVWRKSGIKKGVKVIDIGSGPGFASFDLAKIVGKSGKTVALERSKNFIDYLNSETSKKKLNINAFEIDLVKDEIPVKNFDFAWSRWAVSFLSDREKFIKKLNKSLKIGGKIIFHEYVEYKTYRILPNNKFIESFVNEVIFNWRNSGGEPNIASELIMLLQKNGFKINFTQPLVYSSNPNGKYWKWPASFIKIHVHRLLEMKRVNKTWVKNILHELEKAESNLNSVMITPMVLEIIAEKIK